MCLLLQVRVAANSRNSAWAAYDGRNRREIKQGDRYIYTHHMYQCVIHLLAPLANGMPVKLQVCVCMLAISWPLTQAVSGGEKMALGTTVHTFSYNSVNHPENSSKHIVLESTV